VWCGDLAKSQRAEGGPMKDELRSVSAAMLSVLAALPW
jgi:hypothetical protein